MSVLVGMLLSFLTGLVCFFMAPIVARALVGGKRNPTTPFCFDLAANLIGRSLLVLRETGSMAFELKQSSFNAELGVEETTIDGETKHFEDPHNYLSRWYNKPFGIADEKRGVIVNPRIAELGEIVNEMRNRGISLQSGGDTWFEGLVPIAAGSTRLVNMNAARSVVAGSATATLADRVETFTEISQSLFDSHPTLQYMVWLSGLGGGFFVMLIAKQFLQSSGGAGTPSVGVGIPFILPLVIP